MSMIPAGGGGDTASASGVGAESECGKAVVSERHHGAACQGCVGVMGGRTVDALADDVEKHVDEVDHLDVDEVEPVGRHQPDHGEPNPGHEILSPGMGN
jgi:hypothetical protein